MNRPQNQGEIMSVAQAQISPVDNRAIALTAQGYQINRR
ncbi:hypothetical protein NIES4102_43870 (plasmid) [Chondrocystis sp. NIES-4102]|nr:hypothetical protein NIES4102_43870 [Chondrocystis sp. NIES-4102]